jgi:hypothetical protein
MIVIITPTIMDGAVLRWYVSKSAAENGDESLSASRNGVRVFGYLDDVPAEVLEQAKRAYETLRAGGDVKNLATHRMSMFSRVLEPIAGVAG